MNSDLQATIKELKQEVEQLRASRDLDSKTSSKPPSTDVQRNRDKSDSLHLDSLQAHNRS